MFQKSRLVIVLLPVYGVATMTDEMPTLTPWASVVVAMMILGGFDLMRCSSASRTCGVRRLLWHTTPTRDARSSTESASSSSLHVASNTRHSCSGHSCSFGL